LMHNLGLALFSGRIEEGLRKRSCP
jgi:hypothetical protein